MSENNKPDVGFVWRITDDVLRNTFKKNEIGDVLLPFVALRRIDCVLKPVNEKVRETYKQFVDKLTPERLEPVLLAATDGKKFYNISKYTFDTLLDDARNIAINFNTYINGFNNEIKDILGNFQFQTTVARLNRNGLLYSLIQELDELDLSPENVDNHDMGYVFEELIRISNEQSNETAGEHFTPRDVIRLMSAILFTPDRDVLRQPGTIRSIYDSTCGTGGMLYVGSNYIKNVICKGIEPGPTIITYGQELNEQTFAVAKMEALITGQEADNIRLGNTLTNDRFPDKHFDYLMNNPPYGITWKNEQRSVLDESMDPDGRFSAGTPRVSDGQLLFIEHLISKMEPKGSRVGVVTNGSPLFSGGAGSGESSIRQWILESDLLECILALPTELFYNTGIATYIWFITNRKSDERKGKVQLIDATSFCRPAKKSLGNKRNDITEEDIKKVLKLYLDFRETEHSKILPNKYFGALQLTIEQPMRDENGKVIMQGEHPKPDSKKRDTEMVPLTKDPYKYFREEVLPHIDSESWIDIGKTRINYEINFSRFFYKYQAPEPSSQIAERIKQREETIEKTMKTLFD